MRLAAKEAADKARGKVIAGRGEAAAIGVSTDTRTLRKGQGFIALKGPRFNAADFAQQALDKGAAWVMIETRDPLPPRVPSGAAVIVVPDTLRALGDLAAAHRRSHPARVAVITGSVGKTTVKEMAACILSGKGRTLKNQGNLNNLVGLPLSLFRLNQGHRFAVLEMGCNQPGEIKRMTEIAGPQAGLITRIAPAHLEGLGSLKGVAKAKAEMLEVLPPSAAFCLNLDDPLLVREARRFKGRLIGFTTQKNLEFPGESIHLVSLEKEVRNGTPCINFILERRQGNRRKGSAISFSAAGLSPALAKNALCAAALGLAFSVPLELAARRLSRFKGLPGRGGVVRTRSGLFIIDDTYNANPASVKEALETMVWWKGPLPGGAVLGDMLELGSYAEKYHREVGEAAARLGLSFLVAVGGLAEITAEAAISKGMPPSRVAAVKTCGEALRFLEGVLKPRMWVLVKGSRAMGMEAVVQALRLR